MRNRYRHIAAGRALPRGLESQKGVVLFIALIALVAITLAALALVRSVDTATMVAGNVALKQAALQEAEREMNEAFRCLDKDGRLLQPGISLGVNNTICNYYASLQPDTKKPYGIPDILKDMKGGTANPNSGNTVYYVIERMCNAAGEWSNDKCVESPFGKGANMTDEGKPTLIPVQALYRISVKVVGPRGINAYSQMILNGTP